MKPLKIVMILVPSLSFEDVLKCFETLFIERSTDDSIYNACSF